MAGFDPTALLDTVVGSLVKFSESIRVVSDPIQVGEKVVIPAAVVRIGFGAGGGSGTKPVAGSSDRAEEGSGGGGGGGMLLTPVFLVVDGESERLIVAPSLCGPVGGVMETIKRAAEGLLGRKEGAEATEED